MARSELAARLIQDGFLWPKSALESFGRSFEGDIIPRLGHCPPARYFRDAPYNAYGYGSGSFVSGTDTQYFGQWILGQVKANADGSWAYVTLPIVLGVTEITIQAPPPCPYPQGETSSYIGKENSAQTGFYGGMFTVTLGGTGDYTGRQVTESFSGMVSSGAGACWSNASPYQQPSYASFGNPSTWTVGGAVYGTDYIGWSVTEANYYQSLMGANQSCSVFQDVQSMTINACIGGPGTTYESHGNAFTITSTSMTASRSVASGPAQ